MRIQSYNPFVGDNRLKANNGSLAQLGFAGGAKEYQGRFKTEKGKKPNTVDFPVKSIQPDLFNPATTIRGKKRFAVIGDAGSGKKAQFDIASAMAKTFKQTPFATVLVLGDNIYEDGEPWLFHERIYQPYKKLFKQGVKFYPVMGNHDIRAGFGDIQNAYWGVPPYYKFRMKDTEFFALDTTLMLPGYDKCHRDNPFLARKKAVTQLKWLNDNLKNSTAKYKVVYGHYPLYSSGMHSIRKDITLKLRKQLEPLLEKYNVDVYLAGHEHHYERSAPIKGVTHFVSGAAGKVRRIFFNDSPNYKRVKATPTYHFMLFEMKKEGLNYQAINREGKVLDQGLIPVKTTTNKASKKPVHLAFA